MLRRRRPEDSSAPSQPTQPRPAPSRSAGSPGPAPVGGKGRPTPSRKAAEAARKAQLKPTMNRREARKRRRAELARERTRMRTAMATGDESGFPVRDRGPVRRYVRDFVDSRRTVAEFMLPLLLLILVLSFFPSRQVQAVTAIVWVSSMLLVIADTTVLGARIKRAVARRFPGADTRGSVFYGIARATQLRRLRLPKPAVRPGQPVRDA